MNNNVTKGGRNKMYSITGTMVNECVENKQGGTWYMINKTPQNKIPKQQHRSLPEKSPSTTQQGITVTNRQME
jgi:hypothetical protein